MSILLNANESQLVLVDYQERLMPAIHEGQRVVERATVLAKVARLLKVPVFLTEQTPDKLGTTDASLKGLVEKTITKTHFSAVADGLSDVLRAPAKPVVGNARSMPKHIRKNDEASERNTVILAGCEAHVCLMQTALELIEEEFDVWVVTDACSSRTVLNRDAAFDRLASNGAELVTTEMVVFEWLKDSQHSAFRDVLQLIK
jgi:nicotinamidase-related amidase